jgi:NAD(P)H-dependent FMN reductase
VTTLVALAGSLRQGSFNQMLLQAAVEAAPKDVKVDTASIKGIPLYDGDLELAGIPEPVKALKDRIAAADGLLLVTPEYNNSMPGAFKNAIDWCTRPPADAPRVWRDKAVALMGATPGVGGTRFAQTAWLPVLRVLGTRLFTGRMIYVAGATKAFDAQGKLVDETVRELLPKFMREFAEFARGR